MASDTEHETAVTRLARAVEKMQYDRERDLAVQQERDKHTEASRQDIRTRLTAIEQQVASIRVAMGNAQGKGIFDPDIKTLVIIVSAVGAVLYEIVRRGGLPQ